MASHELLCRAAADAALPPAFPLRRPSICLDATPLVYSATLDPSGSRAFRMLVEPGGTGIDVPSQVEVSLALLDRLCAVQGWDRAAAELRTVAALVFPDDPAPMRSWWGGAWVGLVLSEAGVEIRLYANLRWGEARARWQRACDAICAFGDERLTPTLEDLVGRAAPLAIPVGLGVVASTGAVRALRLYVAVHEPTPAAIVAALPAELSDAGLVGRLCERFAERFGPEAPRPATLGYDFIRDCQGIHPGLPRAKVDISCQLVEGCLRPRGWGLARGLAAELGLDAVELERLEEDLAAAFGGAEIEFVSLSLRAAGPSLTVYAKPHGFPADARLAA